MTSKDQLRARLHALYADGSKHAVYQNVPEFVRDALGYQERIDAGWRSDTPRYTYFSERLKLPAGGTLADVGANTGYFALNFAHAHRTWKVTAFEPNPSHRDFIREIADAFELSNVTVKADAWTRDTVAAQPPFDAVLCLNILHHAGFDFDPQLPDTNEAFLAYADEYLKRLGGPTTRLCFQMGSNRGGKKDRPLFPFDDDVERLASTWRLMRNAGWTMAHVGVAAKTATGEIHYRDLPPELMLALHGQEFPRAAAEAFYSSAGLAQFPGEFYRRPLLICRRADSLTA